MNPNNLFVINGYLTKAPVLRDSENGKHYAFLNLAVDNGYGKDSKPDYLSVAVWGKQAENCVKYLVKGQNVSVSGPIRTVMGKDKQLHVKLNAEAIQFGKKPQLSKEKDQAAEVEKIESTSAEPVEDPSPIEPPEEFFAEEPTEDTDLDI